MLIAFVHFLFNLIIALVILRLAQAKLAERYGADNPAVKALAFID